MLLTTPRSLAARLPLARFVYRKLTGTVDAPPVWTPSPVGIDGGGARVDIDVSRGEPPVASLDVYQRAHWRRYEFALARVPAGGDVGDFACGTGYGSVLLARRARAVVGIDLDAATIETVRRRYEHVPNVTFAHGDLLALDAERAYDSIVSFETIEHLAEDEIRRLFAAFGRAVRPGGGLILSTPYRQEPSPAALAGFHRTFDIDVERVADWLAEAGFAVREIRYQRYGRDRFSRRGRRGDFLLVVAARRPD